MNKITKLTLLMGIVGNLLYAMDLPPKPLTTEQRQELRTLQGSSPEFIIRNSSPDYELVIYSLRENGNFAEIMRVAPQKLIRFFLETFEGEGKSPIYDFWAAYARRGKKYHSLTNPGLGTLRVPFVPKDKDGKVIKNQKLENMKKNVEGVDVTVKYGTIIDEFSRKKIIPQVKVETPYVSPVPLENIKEQAQGYKERLKNKAQEIIGGAFKSAGVTIVQTALPTYYTLYADIISIYADLVLHLDSIRKVEKEGDKKYYQTIVVEDYSKLFKKLLELIQQIPALPQNVVSALRDGEYFFDTLIDQCKYVKECLEKKYNIVPEIAEFVLIEKDKTVLEIERQNIGLAQKVTKAAEVTKWAATGLWSFIKALPSTAQTVGRLLRTESAGPKLFLPISTWRTYQERVSPKTNILMVSYMLTYQNKLIDSLLGILRLMLPERILNQVNVMSYLKATAQEAIQCLQGVVLPYTDRVVLQNLGFNMQELEEKGIKFAQEPFKMPKIIEDYEQKLSQDIRAFGNKLETAKTASELESEREKLDVEIRAFIDQVSREKTLTPQSLDQLKSLAKSLYSLAVQASKVKSPQLRNELLENMKAFVNSVYEDMIGHESLRNNKEFLNLIVVLKRSLTKLK